MTLWSTILLSSLSISSLLIRHVSGDTGTSQDLPWPYNLPPHVKYYPADEALVRRHADVQRRLQNEVPLGMKKMSGDPGEKFFLDYWTFDRDHTEIDTTGTNVDNTTTPFKSPFQLHADMRPRHPRTLPKWLLQRSVFDRRGFECPAGSQACAAIDRPNSCCADGSTCQLIQDTGLGDVGCCPSGEVCAGSLSQCPPGGYTNCPNNPGGGCCLPGYACLDIGCVLITTNTVTVVVTPTTRSTSSTTSPLLTSTVTETSTATAVIPPSTTSIVSPSTTSPTVTPSSSSTTPTPSSSIVNTLICSSGYRACPASLGGGCCPTDRACGRGFCPEMSSTASFSVPGRPTSDSSGTATTQLSSTRTSSSSTTPVVGCPTGFYACSAYYLGGCCQVGRNCDTTSCPASGSITVVGQGSVTAVAPTGNGITSAGTLLTGTCAGGWSTCPPDVGGGCCPTGYACGAACTATVSGGATAEIGKIAPNAAHGFRMETRGYLVVGLSFLSIAPVLELMF